VKHIDRIRETDDISTISVHGGNSCCESKLLDKPEFLFRKQNVNWHFHAEELLPIDGMNPTFSIKYRDSSHDFWTRYLHAQANTELIERCHIDGAVRVYGNESSFIRRHAEQLKPGEKFNSETERMKLFRIDPDPQPLPSFDELIGLFLTQNPYLREFRESETDESADLQELRSSLLENSPGT
jgi:hypothetical protein